MFLITTDYWEVKKTKEKGYGIFAKKEIKAGTIIGDYLGKVLKTAEYDLIQDKKGLYLMYLTDQASIYPDLKKPGVHLLNHSCSPNCWIYVYRGHTLFFTLRNIKEGEELTIDYLLSPDQDCKPCTHICKCRSKKCRGSMHISENKFKEWQTFQTREKKKTRIAKFTYGKNLTRLSSYPKINLNKPIYAFMQK